MELQAQCTTIKASGQRCTNKAKENGKCPACARLAKKKREREQDKDHERFAQQKVGFWKEREVELEQQFISAYTEKYVSDHTRITDEEERALAYLKQMIADTKARASDARERLKLEFNMEMKRAVSRQINAERFGVQDAQGTFAPLTRVPGLAELAPSFFAGPSIMPQQQAPMLDAQPHAAPTIESIRSANPAAFPVAAAPAPVMVSAAQNFAPVARDYQPQAITPEDLIDRFGAASIKSARRDADAMDEDGK